MGLKSEFTLSVSEEQDFLVYNLTDGPSIMAESGQTNYVFEPDTSNITLCSDQSNVTCSEKDYAALITVTAQSPRVYTATKQVKSAPTENIDGENKSEHNTTKDSSDICDGEHKGENNATKDSSDTVLTVKSPERTKEGTNESSVDQDTEQQALILISDCFDRLADGANTSDPERPSTADDEKERLVSAVETKQEAWWRILLEVVLPFLMAGFGTVGAGLLLDMVQHWTVFVEVSEIFILVPALLGLKGNLEMTLASRLSTQANLGNMDSRSDQIKMILGNLALTQVQAIVVGFLASMAAMIFGWIPKGKFDIYHGFLLCASSVMTAALASLILGTIMILVILASRKLHINPDNVATPIAASLGDITTLALLSTIAAGLYKVMKTIPWLAPTLLFLFLALTPVWWVVSHKNKFVHNVLYTGWTPVIGAMIISSMGGLILDFTVANYPGIAVFQPVINGVGGNLVAVQASRLSTSLHLRSTPGSLPESSIQGCPNICQVFFNSGVIARTSRVLMLMVVPGHLVFIYTIHYLQDGDLHTPITIFFCISYLIAATIQVAVLLYISVWLVHWLWKRGNDPDNFSIPYLTALGDLLGTGLLALAFHLLVTLGDKSIIEVATGSGDGALTDGGL